MRPRDLIVVGAVVLVAGFAAADALRSRAESGEQAVTTPAVQTGPTRLPGPQPQPSAPEGWPVGTLPGALVFTDAEDCRLRVIGLAGGVERPLARFLGTCELWAAPVGQRVAYGLGPSSADGFVPFKLADLALPLRELGGYRALFGVVLWSQDGQRVAWCGRRRVGFDLEIGGPARRLPTCPAAFTPGGEIAYAVGNELTVEDREILRVRGGITHTTFLADGTVVLEVNGERLEKYGPDGFRRYTVGLPAELQGRTPIVSPDGCGVLFRHPDRDEIHLINLGCPSGPEPRVFNGRAAAWDPEGHWIAVAESEAIAFHQVVGGDFVARWPAVAAELAWRPR